MDNTLMAKAIEIVKDHSNSGEKPYCSVAVINDKGYPYISTKTIAKYDGIKTLYFGTGFQSEVVAGIKNNDKSAVCLNSSMYTLTLEGTMKIRTEADIKKEMWYDDLSAHFKNGAEDENFCVLEFTTKEYSGFVDFKEFKGVF